MSFLKFLLPPLLFLLFSSCSRDPSFNITVDNSQSIAQMLVSGKYDTSDACTRYIGEVKQFQGPFDKNRGKENIKIYLLRFYRFGNKEWLKAGMKEGEYYGTSWKSTWSKNEIRFKIDSLGLKPANLAELISFGAKYPETLKRNRGIFDLGTPWREHIVAGEEEECLAYLYEGESYATPLLCRNGDPFHDDNNHIFYGDSYFLAVKK